MATENSTFGIGVGVNYKSCKRRSLWPPTKKGSLHPLNPTSHNMHYKKPPPPPPPHPPHSQAFVLSDLGSYAYVTRHPTPLTTPTNLDVWLRLVQLLHCPETKLFMASHRGGATHTFIPSLSWRGGHHKDFLTHTRVQP